MHIHTPTPGAFDGNFQLSFIPVLANCSLSFGFPFHTNCTLTMASYMLFLVRSVFQSSDEDHD